MRAAFGRAAGQDVGGGGTVVVGVYGGRAWPGPRTQTDLGLRSRAPQCTRPRAEDVRQIEPPCPGASHTRRPTPPPRHFQRGDHHERRAARCPSSRRGVGRSQDANHRHGAPLLRGRRRAGDAHRRVQCLGRGARTAGQLAARVRGRGGGARGHRGVLARPVRGTRRGGHRAAAPPDTKRLVDAWREHDETCHRCRAEIERFPEDARNLLAADRTVERWRPDAEALLSRTISSARCVYLRVVFGLEWPSNRPIARTLSPWRKAKLAYVCRRSWSRTSATSASLRMRFQKFPNQVSPRG